jgi:D-sedoheptulose 7-phosphate isomerase
MEEPGSHSRSMQRTLSASLLATDALARLQNHVKQSIDTKQRLVERCGDEILAAAEQIAFCFQQGGKLLLCGNGGSAADAQHLAAEFVSVLTQSFLRPGLPAMALTTDSSILTASANDFGFEGIFSRQVQALGRAGDVLLGLSTSGNSENVIRAICCAREHGIFTIVLTGESGGKMAGLANLAIRVPSAVTAHIQESHLMIGHILCDLSERAVFPPDTAV